MPPKSLKGKRKMRMATAAEEDQSRFDLIVPVVEESQLGIQKNWNTRWWLKHRYTGVGISRGFGRPNGERADSGGSVNVR